MTVGTPLTYSDPSVLISTYSKGVLLDPPTARRAVVFYFAGEDKSDQTAADLENTVQDTLF